MTKKDESVRLCVTIKDRYPFPRTDDFMDQLVKACMFTKIDLKLGYHQIVVKFEDIPKTTFRTFHGHYEYMVMSFGVTHALGIDDILVYLKTREEHIDHLRMVLQVLKDKQLYAKMLKCNFWLKEVSFLVVVKWKTPRSISEMKSFFGLVDYCRSFLELKKRLISAIVLVLPNPREPFVVYCDASKMSIGGMLMQRGKVVTYASRQLNTHERNYPIHNQKLTTLVFVLNIWRHYLYGAKFENMRQRRWLEYPKDFDFDLSYHSSKANVVGNA
ncbi:Retrovirus-related Pol polyprotein, partial [Mucuna pruriens]